MLFAGSQNLAHLSNNELSLRQNSTPMSLFLFFYLWFINLFFFIVFFISVYGFLFLIFSNRGLMSYLVFFLILISHFRESKLARCIRFILIFWSRGQREADCAKIYEIKSHSSFFKNEIVGFFSSDEFLD